MINQNAKLYQDEKEICDCTTTKVTPLKVSSESSQGFLLSIDCFTDNSDKLLEAGKDLKLKLLEDGSEYKLSLKVVYKAADEIITPVLAITFDAVEFNKRKDKRHDTNISGYVEVNNKIYPSIISDISEQGLAVITLRNLNLDQQILINILDDGNQLTRFKGSVKRKNFSHGLSPKVYQYGIELAKMIEEEKEILRDIIDMLNS